MNKLKISTRLLVLVGLLSLLLMAIGSLGLYGIEKTNTSVETVYRSNTVPMGQIAEIQERLLRNRLAIAVALVTPDAETIQRSTAQVEENIAAVTRVWDSYFAGVVAPKEKELASTFAANRGRFVRRTSTARTASSSSASARSTSRSAPASRRSSSTSSMPRRSSSRRRWRATARSARFRSRRSSSAWSSLRCSASC